MEGTHTEPPCHAPSSPAALFTCRKQLFFTSHHSIAFNSSIFLKLCITIKTVLIFDFKFLKALLFAQSANKGPRPDYIIKHKQILLIGMVAG
jgi:hypothetical protein